MLTFDLSGRRMVQIDLPCGAVISLTTGPMGDARDVFFSGFPIDVIFPRKPSKMLEKLGLEVKEVPNQFSSENRSQGWVGFEIVRTTVHFGIQRCRDFPKGFFQADADNWKTTYEAQKGGFW